MRKILHSTAITSLRPAMFRDRANLQDSPWTLRDCNIHVLFEKCTIGQLLKGISDHNLVIKQVHRVHLMLEALRERQRMFTSCGWYFEAFDRIKPKNNVSYVTYLMRQIRLATGVDLETTTRSNLQRVDSQRSQLQAANVFQSHPRRSDRMEAIMIDYADWFFVYILAQLLSQVAELHPLEAKSFP